MKEIIWGTTDKSKEPIMKGDTSMDESDHADSSARKRKRVTRACDECRKKKVKCDGQLPCIHCTVYSYKCTYDQPSSRRKFPDPLKIETRLKCAELVVEAMLPGVDIYSRDFDLQGFLESLKHEQVQNTMTGTGNDQSLAMARLSAFKFQRPSVNSPASGEFGSTSSQGYSPQGSDHPVEFKIILPSKQVAVELIESVWENACLLFRFYHRPSFIRDLDLLYETDPEDYTDKQYKILPLVYSVMAVGALFTNPKSAPIKDQNAEGYKYFAAARKLIDITDARDTYAIQSIVMMILFLQCSARLSTCYSYIGIALRSALRAGLHRKVVGHNFNPIEQETRKRLFWSIRKMDIYVNAMLGLPRGIDEDEFDQEMPMDIDDENITEDGYFPQQDGKLSSVGISNAHTRLINILCHIMKVMYSVKKSVNISDTIMQQQQQQQQQQEEYMIQYNEIENIEIEIQKWADSLPESLKPGSNDPQHYKANRILSLAYCYIQIVLYRPFIHYCGPAPPQYTMGEEEVRARRYGRKCIQVSKKAVYFANDLVSKDLLSGSYWFGVYTLFFSVASLIYYVHENSFNQQDFDDYSEIVAAAELGKNTLSKLKDSSMAGQRTYKLLQGLFEQLNKRASGANASANAAAQHATMRATLTRNGDPVVETNEKVEEPFSPFQTEARDQMPIGNQLLPPAQQPQPSRSGSGSTNRGSFAYAPGLMDQVDMQLFGRFLPPYMMSQPPIDNNNNVNANLSGTSNTTSNVVNDMNSFLYDSMFTGKTWDDFLSQNVEFM